MRERDLFKSRVTQTVARAVDLDTSIRSKTIGQRKDEEKFLTELQRKPIRWLRRPDFS